MLGDGDAGLRFSGGLSAWENYFKIFRCHHCFESFVAYISIYQKEWIKAFVFAFKFVFSTAGALVVVTV